MGKPSTSRRSTRRRLLTRPRHAVFELSPDLWLVFKPAGHIEAAHSHTYRQRLRVLRGELQVEMPRRQVRLRPKDSPLTIAACRIHATLATADTWLIVERLEVPRS